MNFYPGLKTKRDLRRLTLINKSSLECKWNELWSLSIWIYLKFYNFLFAFKQADFAIFLIWARRVHSVADVDVDRCSWWEKTRRQSKCSRRLRRLGGLPCCRLLAPRATDCPTPIQSYWSQLPWDPQALLKQPREYLSLMNNSIAIKLYAYFPFKEPLIKFCSSLSPNWKDQKAWNKIYARVLLNRGWWGPNPSRNQIAYFLYKCISTKI